MNDLTVVDILIVTGLTVSIMALFGSCILAYY